MRRTHCLAALLVLLGASRLLAVPQIFTATMDGPSESPANASAGTGFATVTIDSAANTMRVQVSFTGLGSNNNAAHIHVINGPGDTNTADTVGPVTTTTPTFGGFPAGTTAGTMDQTYDMTLSTSYRSGWITDSGGTTALAEAALFSGIASGRAYLNIHTINIPGGEIRGFLVPEPASASIAVLAFAGLLRFRRTHKEA